MSFIDDLIKTPEGRKLYEREGLIFRVTEMISTAMEQRGVKKADLARRLGTNKSHITQLLNGHQNMTLAKVADVMLALGYRLEIAANEVEESEQPQPSEVAVPVISNYKISFQGLTWKTEKSAIYSKPLGYSGAA